MDKHIEVIGIDHGWSGMKTVSQVFTTGVKEITTEPAFFNNVVEYNGSYYKVGGRRLEVRDLKVENDNFYLLTLAAVAKELNRRGMRNANVLLSVGLPLTRFGAEKQDFIDYLSRNKEVTFRFDNEQYRMNIARVSVFPQCYAAVADRMKTLPKRVVVVDIGSWTIDIMPIEDSAPNEAECITIREAHGDCLAIVRDYPELKGVFHCYSGSAEMAKELLRRGQGVSHGVRAKPSRGHTQIRGDGRLESSSMAS